MKTIYTKVKLAVLIGSIAGASVPFAAKADRQITADLILDADEDWSNDGTVTLSENVKIDLAGHSLRLARLSASAGSRFDNSGAVTSIVHFAVSGGSSYATLGEASFIDGIADLALSDNVKIVLDNGSSAVSATALNVGSDSTARATYGMSDGTLGATAVSYVGDHGMGEFLQTGGAVTLSNFLVLGENVGSTGTYDISGGSLLLGNSAAGFTVGQSGVGEMTIRGNGEVTNKGRVAVGYRLGGFGKLSVQGGGLSVDGTVTVGANGSGILDVSGATVHVKGGLSVGTQAPGRGEVNVHDGGKIVAPYVEKGHGLASVVFDGGTFQAYGNNAFLFNYFRGLDGFTVGPNGMTFDTGDNTVFASGAGLGAKGAEGAISKTGSGKLAFDVLPCVGTLSVREGTLAITTRTKPALAHRWSFNGDYRDAVTGDEFATPDGDVVFTNGNTQVHLEGGARGASKIALGAGRIPSENVTLEFFFTMRKGQNYSKLFALGSDSKNCICVSLDKNSTTGPLAIAARIKDVSIFANDEGWGKLTANVPHHVAVTFTPNGNGGLWIQACARNLSTGERLGSIGKSVSNCRLSDVIHSVFDLGHSSFWSDNAASVTYDEVRVWDGVLSDTQLAESAALGPDALPGEAADVGNVLSSAATDGIKANNYLLHRWTFNGDGEDKIGDHDAALKGTTLPVYVGGTSVRLAGGPRGTSWIDLGANAIPATLGDTPFTIETWTTMRGFQDWSQAFAFGSSTVADNPETVAGKGKTGLNFVYRRDAGADANRPAFRPAGSNLDSNHAIGATVLSTDVEYHIAETVMPNGDGKSATIRAYVFDAKTGKLISSLTKAVTDWTTSKIDQKNFWLGHSWWDNPDPQADFNEVRMWAAALSEKQLRVNNACGPDRIPAITADSALPNASLGRLDVSAGTKVDLCGNSVELPAVSGMGVITNGTLNVTGCVMPGGDGAVGTLVFSADTAVTGKVRLDIGDRIEAAGRLDLTEATVEIADPSNLGGSVVFATSATGGIAGPVKAFDRKGYRIKISPDGRKASIVRKGFMMVVR